MASSGSLAQISPSLERAVLALVRAGQPNASWHWLATRLPLYDVPLVPDVLTVLEALRERGLVMDQIIGGGLDAWSLTDAGRARLEALESVEALKDSGPLSAAELAQLTAALRGGAQATIAALMPYADDGAKMRAVLQRALASDHGLAERVAFGAAMLPASERAVFANELAVDPRPSVRAALFSAWAPARKDIPGEAVRVLSDRDWDALLRRGLSDAEVEVRSAAAALTFASDAGGGLVDELMACLRAPVRELRYWAILSLGAAGDAPSLEALERFAGDREPMLAAAAVRALAARRDGHERWLAALGDPRADVYQAAVFALAEVAVALAPEHVERIERDARAAVQAALSAYRARSNVTSTDEA